MNIKQEMSNVEVSSSLQNSTVPCSLFDIYFRSFSYKPPLLDRSKPLLLKPSTHIDSGPPSPSSWAYR
jgi:hypothetical protein